MAQGRLGLGKGEPHLGKGHGRCFGDVHECVQPWMGISFFWRSFWVLRELGFLYHSFPEQQAGMKSLCLLVGVKTRLVSECQAEILAGRRGGLQALEAGAVFYSEFIAAGLNTQDSRW